MITLRIHYDPIPALENGQHLEHMYADSKYRVVDADNCVMLEGRIVQDFNVQALYEHLDRDNLLRCIAGNPGCSLAEIASVSRVPLPQLQASLRGDI